MTEPMVPLSDVRLIVLNALDATERHATVQEFLGDRSMMQAFKLSSHLIGDATRRIDNLPRS